MIVVLDGVMVVVLGVSIQVQILPATALPAPRKLLNAEDFAPPDGVVVLLELLIVNVDIVV